MLIAGLNIPRISEYLLIVTALGLLFRWLMEMRIDSKVFFVTLSLLIMFVSSYYTFTCIHGITGLAEGVRNGLTILGSYAVGYCISSRNTPVWPRWVCIPLYCMVAGFICFAFLSVQAFLHTASLAEIAERVAINFWDGSNVNSPGFGANASLGMCLLPVIFYGKSDDCNGLRYWLLAVTIALFFVAGFYINVALQNRTPFLATSASLFIGTVIYLRRHRADLVRNVRKLTVIGLLAGIAVYYLAMATDLSQFSIVTRFTEERLETSRYQAWSTMLSSLHYSLLGGRVVKLGEDLNYVHNLWLDVFWDAGIVPFIILTGFHFKHLHSFKTILQADLPLFVVLTVTGMGVSFFANFMQEPTLTASVPYFAGSCFFLGLVLRLSQNLENEMETP